MSIEKINTNNQNKTNFDIINPDFNIPNIEPQLEGNIDNSETLPNKLVLVISNYINNNIETDFFKYLLDNFDNNEFKKYCKNKISSYEKDYGFKYNVGDSKYFDIINQYFIENYNLMLFGYSGNVFVSNVAKKTTIIDGKSFVFYSYKMDFYFRNKKTQPQAQHMPNSFTTQSGMSFISYKSLDKKYIIANEAGNSFFQKKYGTSLERNKIINLLGVNLSIGEISELYSDCFSIIEDINNGGTKEITRLFLQTKQYEQSNTITIPLYKGSVLFFQHSYKKAEESPFNKINKLINENFAGTYINSYTISKYLETQQKDLCNEIKDYYIELKNLIEKTLDDEKQKQ